MSNSGVGQFISWLAASDRAVLDGTYDALWEWSVKSPNQFWPSLWQYLQIQGHGELQPTTIGAQMPDVKWFPRLRVNYSEQALRSDWPDDALAVLAFSQSREVVQLTYGELRADVARARVGLRRLGVGIGDRVAGYVPNIPEAIVMFLATASLGAIWSSCAPEFGVQAVVDRLAQIKPKVLIAVDGYQYGAKYVDRSQELADIQHAIQSLAWTVVIPYVRPRKLSQGEIAWDEFMANTEPLAHELVPFAYPLYILFSSGTTGLPKPIIHCHGGIMLQHLKDLRLHLDVGQGDRMLWYTTTGWMLWNVVVSSLLAGATAICFDGDPLHPNASNLWSIVEQARATYFGAGASYFMNCRRLGLRPGNDFDMSSLRGIGSTGSPLPVEGYEWVYEAVGRSVLLGSMSGGTDVCAILVGPSPLVPVWAGEISCRALGTLVEAYDESGRPLVGQQGELVISKPIPSMPVGFWGDPNGVRFRSTYFERFPGVWCHGDWITITDRGTSVISGRSDATLKRGGVRMGTSEFYSVVETIPEVKDSLVVHLEDSGGGPGQLLLFVALAENTELDAALRNKICSALSASLSPRHVPDQILEAPSIPKTLTQKKLEVPVKRILAGAKADQVVSKGSMMNPGSLTFYEELAQAMNLQSHASGTQS
jgi:acetoacetyl-CoA synthetase